MNTVLKIIFNITRINLDELTKWIKSSNVRYKTYLIPKKNNKGKREIHHPSKQLKLLQNIIKEEILEKFPIHNSALAYVRDANILDNALLHKSNRYLLRLDFKDFFPSIKSKDISYFLKKNSKKYLDQVLNQEDIETINKIICRYGELTIGAPTSPITSNIVMYEFDSQLSKICEEKGVIYSRYADDMYFSTNQGNILKNFLEIIPEILEQEGMPNLKINHDKNIFTSKKDLGKLLD